MDSHGALDLGGSSYPIPTRRSGSEIKTLADLRRQLDAEDRVREGLKGAGFQLPKGRTPILPIGGGMDYYITTPIPPFNSAIGASFATFTTLKDVSPTPLPNIFGNQLRASSGLWLEAHGEFSTTGTPTLQFAVIYGAVAGAAGGVNLSASAAITTGSGAAAWPWFLTYNGVVTATGSTGSITGQGILFLGTSLTAFSLNAMPVTAAARVVAIDTTVAKLIGIGAAWGTSSGSNAVKVYNVAPLLLN